MKYSKRMTKLISAALSVIAVLIVQTEYVDAAKKSDVIGWISIQPDKRHAGKVRIRAMAYSDKTVSGRYFFSLKRKGRSGVAHSNQSGAFTTYRGGNRVLSQTTIRMPKSGIFQATLKLVINGKVAFSVVLNNKL